MHGQWSEWKDWTSCSKTCGTGTQERERSCTNPPPAFGGEDCVGLGRQITSCQEKICAGKRNQIALYILIQKQSRWTISTNSCLSPWSYFPFFVPQFTEAGVPGRTGALVPKHVDLDNKQESENVIAPGQNMEEDRVRGLENKCECATPGNVQVRFSPLLNNFPVISKIPVGNW